MIDRPDPATGDAVGPDSTQAPAPTGVAGTSPAPVGRYDLLDEIARGG